MKIGTFFASMIVGSLFTFSFPCRAVSQQEQTAGFIDDVRGIAYLKKGEQSIRLDPKRDKRRALHPGETLRCERGGHVLFKLCAKSDDENCKPIEVTSAKEFPIPPMIPALTDSERKRQGAMQEYGRSGGRPMGVLSPLFSPSSDSAVRPGTLVLRWVPSPELSSFSLTIEDTSQRRIWDQKIADGASGYLVSESLRQALTKYRNEHGKSPLLLELEDRNHIGSQLRFSLLSEQEEQDLDNELADWNREPDIFLRHLGRAHAFYMKNMFVEVAEEFEAALAETPESRDVLLRTIQAHRDAGNSAREDELERRLGP